MNRVFVGGSRRIKGLNTDARNWIDHFIDLEYTFLVGDANGVDKAAQMYLRSKDYHHVIVFYVGEICRNNVADWPTRRITPHRSRKDYSFYAAKDQAMAEEASLGLMLWDRKSIGTIVNISRLIQQRKRAILLIDPGMQKLELQSHADWDRLVEDFADELRSRILSKTRIERSSEHSEILPLQRRLL